MPIPSLAEAATESERVILGTLLAEPERLQEAQLSVSHFGLAGHRSLYDTMLRLAARGETWDAAIVVEEMSKRKKLDAMGGAAAVAGLLEGLPRRLPLAEHVTRIRSAALRRKLASFAGHVKAACDDIGEDPEALLIRVREQLAEISSGAVSTSDLISLASIAPQRVLWLWELYLPAGMLSLLSGDPGCGKTYMGLAVAASLSLGKIPASGESCEPTSTVYLSRENDPARVVRPRFDLLGGDASRLHLLGQDRPVTLSNLSELDAALATTGARLMVIDPIQSFLGAEIDAHRANETRPVLDGLARLAQERQCCILLLRHLAKSNTGRAIHRGLGSVDFTGAVRTELLAGSAADDPESRALVMLKSNLGRFAPSLAYRIDSSGFRWLGNTNLRASDVLAAEMPRGDGASTEVDDWLRNCLADGSKPANDVFAEAKEAGWSKWQVRRAKDRIGVRAAQAIGKKSGGWSWFLSNVLPEQSEQSDSKYADETSDCTLQPDSSLQPDTASGCTSDCTERDMQPDRNPNKDGQIASGCSDCTLSLSGELFNGPDSVSGSRRIQ